MILTVSFHFRELFIPDLIMFISFVIFLVSSVFMKRQNEVKKANLFIIGSSIGVLWYFINFFIPGILLPLVPTPEDIEFTLIYGRIFTGIIPDAVLILSLGILPLVIFYKNKSSNSILFLALGASIQIAAVILSFDLYNPILTIILLTLTAISMACYAFYGYKIRNFVLILFSLSFFVARLLYLLMI